MSATARASESAVDSLAEAYVQFVLKIGHFEPDFVDAYFGPESWRTAIDSAAPPEFPYIDLANEGHLLIQALTSLPESALSQTDKYRVSSLQPHVIAALAIVDRLDGRRISFDEESKKLFDAVLPHRDSLFFQRALNLLDDLLPGTGPVSKRYIEYTKQFKFPPERLDTIFRTCVEECRRRTRGHITLPENERFSIEYVSNKPWGAYNWYRGNGESLIQVNSDRGFDLGGLLGTAAHEGYPGHHVLAVIQEKQLYHDSGWVEYAVQPLYCPSSLISEGLANLGIDVLFTPSEKRQFYREILFPVAGLDTSLVDQYLQVMQEARAMDLAWTEAARMFLDGAKTERETVEFLVKYAGRSEGGAKEAIDFYKNYRSYVINYTLGEELTRNYVFRGDPDSSEIWARYLKLMVTPMTASDLVKEPSRQ